MTTYAHNGRSDLVGKTDPGALVQAYSFDGVRNRTRLTDPNGGVWTSTFDALDRVSAAITPAGYAYTWAFDANARLTTLQFGLGSLRQNQYDGENRQIGISAPGGLSTYTFHGDGLRRSAQEPGSVVTTFVSNGTCYLGEVN